MTVATMTGPGLWLSGEYLGGTQERDRTTDDGRTFAGRYKVKLLVDDRVFQVEYRGEDEAVEAIGTPERGDVVTVPVGVRSAKGFTFYYGRRPGGEG